MCKHNPYKHLVQLPLKKNYFVQSSNVQLNAREQTNIGADKHIIY